MFNIEERPEFTRTVRIAVPADGGFREETMKARFRALPDDEADAFKLDDPEGIKRFLRAVIVELEDLVGEDGKPIAWSDEVRELVLFKAYARNALMRTYFMAVVGAREGN
ncbi:MAG: hypothetical protein ACK4NW_10020 [Roseinatronobacter sp.]